MYVTWMKPSKIETLMDLKHARRQHVLDNLSKSEPVTLPWDDDFGENDYIRDGLYALA